MKALLSIILSSMLLSLSIHAGSSTKSSTTSKSSRQKKQKMESGFESPKKKKTDNRGFEYNPRPYSPSSTPQERIQTED